MSKMKFSVCFCSGEEPEYPSTELNTHSPYTRGWQSLQFCDYPQELGLVWQRPARVTQVQILSHQSKIATRIELFIGHGHDYETADFRRLGYLSLDSNERSGFQARELKSVYVDAPGRFLRMLVHKCHVNEINIFNQVGIVAVNLLGDTLAESPQQALLFSQSSRGADRCVAPAHPSERRVRAARGAGPNRADLNDLSFDMNYDPDTARRIREIAIAKEKAVQREDYDTAKILKETETHLKSLGQQLAKLEVAKREAVEDEDYDRAKVLKVEADALRLQINSQSDVRIPEDVEGDRTEDGSGFPGPKAALELPRVAPQSADTPNQGRSDLHHQVLEDERPIIQRNSQSGMKSSGPDGVSEYGFGDGGNAAEGSLVPSSPSAARASVLSLPEGQGPLPSGLHQAQAENGGLKRTLDEDPDRNGEENESNVFPPGQHPLAAIPNYENLPPPEPLSTKVDLAEVQRLTSLFGEYVTRCLYSKNWSLREAAILKVKNVLETSGEESDINTIFSEVCQVLRVGCEDKIAQVFLTTLDLMDTALHAIASCKDARHNHVVTALEPFVATLLVKLGDGQARLRDAALNGLIAVARYRIVGASFLSQVTLKPLPKRQLSAWRTISARLNLLRRLVREFGVEGNSGLSTNDIMSFVKSCNGFAHSNGEVRDAARELTVELHLLVGDEIEVYLTSLRPKQLDEYHEAFATANGKRADCDADRGSSRGSGSRGTPRRAVQTAATTPLRTGCTPRGREKLPSTPKTTPISRQSGRDGTRIDEEQDMDHEQSMDRRKNGNQSLMSEERNRQAQASAVEPTRPGVAYEDIEEETEDDVSNTCQFCGKYDPAFTDELLDMHYWQECPMLMSCQECGQVIETSSLPEHLLDECQNREGYTECNISCLAIKTEELERWQSSDSCRPPGKGGPHSTCPLCFDDVGSAEDEDAWKHHLMDLCRRNPRRTLVKS